MCANWNFVIYFADDKGNQIKQSSQDDTFEWIIKNNGNNQVKMFIARKYLHVFGFQIFENCRFFRML